MFYPGFPCLLYTFSFVYCFVISFHNCVFSGTAKFSDDTIERNENDGCFDCSIHQLDDPVFSFKVVCCM